MKTLVKRNFVATPAEIERMTRDMIAADNLLTDYLKCLVATTQAELGEEIRLRSAAKPGKIAAEQTALDLGALQKVHERFYAAVLRGLSDVPAKERNSRSNFARTAKSSLFTWMKAGFDIRDIAPARVSKSALQLQRAGKRAVLKLAAKAFEHRAMKFVKLVGQSAQLVEDKQAAAAAIGKAMSKLAAMLAKLGVTDVTNNQRRALKENTLLQTPTGIFMPIGGSDIVVRPEVARRVVPAHPAAN